MPYEKEHACRLREPDTMNIIGSREREHNGKKYRIIFGVLKSGGNGSVEQAYRYPKDAWTAKEARSHCNQHNGSFEAALVQKAADRLRSSVKRG